MEGSSHSGTPSHAVESHGAVLDGALRLCCVLSLPTLPHSCVEGLAPSTQERTHTWWLWSWHTAALRVTAVKRLAYNLTVVYRLCSVCCVLFCCPLCALQPDGPPQRLRAQIPYVPEKYIRPPPGEPPLSRRKQDSFEPLAQVPKVTGGNRG